MKQVAASADDIDACLRGERLYGDDFSDREIAEWFADEKDGYFRISDDAKSKPGYVYEYTALNVWHGYSKLPGRRFAHVVGFGAAYGDELRPILGQCDRVSILEPSDGFVNADLDGVPLSYLQPDPSGTLPFADSSVDLITCFGVLHHIPNVSKVISEFHRVLSPGGFALVREPTNSMGDWRMQRPGLTRRERGIPANFLRKSAVNSGLAVLSESRCDFSLTARLNWLTGSGVFNSKWVVAFDAVVSALPVWPQAYHPVTLLQKLRPASVFLVLQKPS